MYIKFRKLTETMNSKSIPLKEKRVCGWVVYKVNLRNSLRTKRIENVVEDNKEVKSFAKLWYIQTWEYYSAIKGNEFLIPSTTQMDLNGIMMSEVSQSQSHILFDSTYIIFLNYKIISVKNKLVVARGYRW